MTEKEVADLKAKYPGEELRELSGGGYTVVIRAPNRAEWLRFKAETLDDRKRINAVEQLFRTCCVYPDAAAVDAMLNKRPGLGDKFASEAVELAGLADGIEKKVL